MIVAMWPVALSIKTSDWTDEPDVISSVNFGVFMIPIGKVINSGSTWIHTYQIEDLGHDPVPKSVRENSTLTYEGCSRMVKLMLQTTFEKSLHNNISQEEVMQVETAQCKQILKISESFNEQKDLLIEAIDTNIEAINTFIGSVDYSNEKPGKRRKSRALELVGKVGEKFFGLGRKKSIDLAHRNHIMLVRQVDNQFNRVAVELRAHRSVMKLSNEALEEAVGQIKEQGVRFNNLTDSLQEIKEVVDRSNKYHMSLFTSLYSIINHQAHMQTQIIKVTMSILNMLQVIHIHTGKVLEGLAQLSRGELPVELIPPQRIDQTIAEVSDVIMRQNLQFTIPITNHKYYYGTNIVGFAYERTITIILRIPLSFRGGSFQLYRVKSVKLPVPNHPKGAKLRQYSKLAGYPEYFAMASDREYYIEFTSDDLSYCRGPENYPKICNPVNIMSSVRDRPSCGLGIFQRNSTMITQHCDRHLVEQERPDSQVYQIGNSADLLVTASEGQFVRHCANGEQMVTIPACELCIIKLPCDCMLRTMDGLVPPLLDNCVKKRNLQTNSTVRYPVNFMVLSQMLNRTEVEKLNGSITFPFKPRVHLWKMEINKIDHAGIIGIQNKIMDLDKAIQLAESNLPMYRSPAAYIDVPQTLAEKLVKMDFTGILHIILMIINLVGVILAYIGYKKGCTSATTAAMALENIKRTKGALTHHSEKIRLPKLDYFVTRSPKEDIAMMELSTYWHHVKPVIYLFATCLVIMALYKIISKTWYYLTTRLVITPFDGIPGISKRSNVFARVSDGINTVDLYVYSVACSPSRVRLVSVREARLTFFQPYSSWPKRVIYFEVYWNMESCLLYLGDQAVKLPYKIRVPITHMRKLRQITKEGYSISLIVGNSIYVELQPTTVSMNLMNSQSLEGRLQDLDEKLSEVRKEIDRYQVVRDLQVSVPKITQEGQNQEDENGSSIEDHDKEVEAHK